MSKKLGNNARTAINIISSFGTTAFGLLISFFLSPYIVRTIGVEANGFVSLAGNFIAYATLVVMALNNMAGRFITIAYVQRDYKRAKLYYNSVFWGNLVIVAVLLIPSVILISNLERVILIPEHLQNDVKILFALVFLAFFLRTGAPNWDCGPLVTNQLHRTYLPGTFTTLLRCVLILVMYWCLPPRVWYSSFIGVVTTLIALGISAYNTHVLTPELKVHFRRPVWSVHAIRELVGSGIWSAIANAGNMLFSGLDLIICNLILGPATMGVLSLSKTIPAILVEFAESMRGAFGPEMTILYAKGDMKELVRIVRRDIKVTMVVISALTGGIIIMSDAFYHLWLPTQDAGLLQMLTVLAILRYVTESGLSILENVFPTTNTVRYNAVGLLISGAVSIIATLLLVVLTDYDLYVIAGTSSVVFIIRFLTFILPASSRFLGLKWSTFYPQVLQSVLSCAVVVMVGYVIRRFVSVDSWIVFFLVCGITAVIGLCVNMVIILNREERQYLIAMFKRRIFKKG